MSWFGKTQQNTRRTGVNGFLGVESFYFRLGTENTPKDPKSCLQERFRIRGFTLPAVTFGRMAQWIERLTTDQEVPGSSPGVVASFSPDQRTLQDVFPHGVSANAVYCELLRSRRAKRVILYFVSLLTCFGP